jgi:glycine/D-amino acid oxidase-like deaminating enzyme
LRRIPAAAGNSITALLDGTLGRGSSGGCAREGAGDARGKGAEEAGHADRFTHLERQASLARAFGLEVEMNDAAEASRLWPVMRTGGVVGAAFSPSGGRVDPSDLCAALIRGALRSGGAAGPFGLTSVAGRDSHGARHGGRLPARCARS